MPYLAPGSDAPTKAPDPVFQDTDTGAWYFYDETWAFAHGPYEDEMIARKGLWLYARWLNSPQHPDVDLLVY